MPAKKSKKIAFSNATQGIMYIILVSIIILSGIKLWLLTQQFENTIQEDTYQVVFLDNDESYFGKLENIGFKYFKLSDVYYLKYFPKLQEQSSEESNYELKLIHLGDQEFYKPQNEMVINKNKIIHWENLQKDSEVMKFILKNKE